MILLNTPWWADISVQADGGSTVLGIIVGVVGSIITLVGVILAIVFYFKPRLPRKELTYHVRSDSPVVSIDKQMGSKIQVYYEDNEKSYPVNDANLLSLQVWNSGKTPVTVKNAVEVPEQDPVEPITLTFVGRTVVSLTELKTNPEEEVIIREANRRAYLTKPSPQPNSIGLPTCFLKPRHSISLTVLLEGPKGEVIGKGTTPDGADLISYEVVQQKKDRRRQWSSFIIIPLLIAGFILSALALPLGLSEVATVLLPAETALVGAAIGFYFGSYSHPNNSQSLQ